MPQAYRDSKKSKPSVNVKSDFIGNMLNFPKHIRCACLR